MKHWHSGHTLAGYEMLLNTGWGALLSRVEEQLGKAQSEKEKQTVHAFQIVLKACMSYIDVYKRQGMIVTARLNSAEPLAGQGYEMDAIAAAVLGGTSMQGGKGNVAGTVVACLILNILKNGLVLLSVSSHYQEVLTGVILVIAVLISESNRRKRSEG